VNTTCIQTTLQTLFQDDTRWVHPCRRLIFWYDPEAQFQDTFNVVDMSYPDVLYIFGSVAVSIVVGAAIYLCRPLHAPIDPACPIDNHNQNKSGKFFQQIDIWLNAQGYSPKRGGGWHRQTVQKVITTQPVGGRLSAFVVPLLPKNHQRGRIRFVTLALSFRGRQQSLLGKRGRFDLARCVPVPSPAGYQAGYGNAPRTLLGSTAMPGAWF
jgi:hypothetical protein